MNLKQVIWDQTKLLQKLDKSRFNRYNDYKLFVLRCQRMLSRATSFVVPEYETLKPLETQFAPKGEPYYMYHDKAEILPFPICFFTSTLEDNYKDFDKHICSSLAIEVSKGLYAMVTYKFSSFFELIAPMTCVLLTTPGNSLKDVLVSNQSLNLHTVLPDYYEINYPGEWPTHAQVYIKNAESAIFWARANSLQRTSKEIKQDSDAVVLSLANENVKIDLLMRLAGSRNVKSINYIPPSGKEMPRERTLPPGTINKILAIELTKSERERYGRREDYVYIPLDNNKNARHWRRSIVKYYGPKYHRGLLFGKYECVVIIPPKLVGRNTALIINNEYVVI